MDKVKFVVQRFNPRTDFSPCFETYEVPLKDGLTVLDGLRYIQKINGRVTLRFSCRMGVCGSCGMVINGLPRLACQTQVSKLKSDIIEVKPLPNHPLIKDLVTDFTTFFGKIKVIKPYMIRRDTEELENPTHLYLQKPEETVGKYLQFTFCVKCGLCVSACPISAIDEQYLGPSALANAYRCIADSRDEGDTDRIIVVDSKHGCWGCHFATSCSTVCPKGVDPAFAIQLLKRIVLTRRLKLLR